MKIQNTKENFGHRYGEGRRSVLPVVVVVCSVIPHLTRYFSWAFDPARQSIRARDSLLEQYTFSGRIGIVMVKFREG